MLPQIQDTSTYPEIVLGIDQIYSDCFFIIQRPIGGSATYRAYVLSTGLFLPQGCPVGALAVGFTGPLALIAEGGSQYFIHLIVPAVAGRR